MRNSILKISTKASLALLIASEALAEQAPITGQHLETEIEDAFGVHSAHPVEGVHEAAHAAHDAAHSSGGLPQLDPTWFASQIFWLSVTFIVLYIIFSKDVLPAISSTLETRREHIQSDLDTARDMKEDAEKVHAAYDELMHEARGKSAALMSETEEKIKAKAAKKLNSLRDKATEKTQAAEAEIEKARKAAMKDMDGIAAEVARQAAEKLVGITTDIKDAKSAVDNINKKAA